MIIQGLIDEMTAPAGGQLEKTVDTVKAGDSTRDVQHVGVCFMATAEVVRKAQTMGVEFLITHEPTYYTHVDALELDHPLVAAKHALVEGSGLTIWRNHDHIHRYQPDGIVEGILKELGWAGHDAGDGFWHLDEPRTPRQMAADIRAKLGCGGVRVSGAADTTMTDVAMAVGAPGFMFTAEIMRHVMDAAPDRRFAFFLGEVCEWAVLEQIRDATALGTPMAALVCGHAASEELGMRLLAERIARRHPELTVDFIPTGEVYQHL